MIFNQLFFGYVVTAIFCAMQVDTFFYRSIPNTDSKLDIAMNLKTGFIYPEYDDLYKLGIASFKKLLSIENLPNENTIKEPIDIIYCDFACGNMYILFNYLEICKNLDDSCLNEKVTRHMIGSLFKINKTMYVKPFWYAHMYTIYSSRLRNENVKPNDDYCNTIVKNTKSKLISDIEKWCRKDNKYKMSIQYDNNLKPITPINNFMEIINEIQINNVILLENEAEKNWASLNSMYLQKIKDDNVLKTIIMTFGDQVKEVYDVIHNDINQEYIKANKISNYHNWIISLRNYQIEMLNIIRTVALHLIRNHLLHSNEYWKLNYKINPYFNVGHENVKNYLSKNHFFKNLFRHDNNKVLDIVNNLNCFKKIENGVNVTHLTHLLNVEKIMSRLLPSFAQKESNVQVIAEFINLDKISCENKNLIESISKENSTKIIEFQKKFDYPPLSANFKRIIFYIQYLEILFEEYNIETPLTCIEAFTGYSKYCHQHKLR